MRNLFVAFVLVLIALSLVASISAPYLLWAWVLLGPIVILGIWDYFQTRHSILRNFPVLDRKSVV